MGSDRTEYLIRIALALGLRHEKIRELLRRVKDPALMSDREAIDRISVERGIVEHIYLVEDDEVMKLRERVEQLDLSIVSIVDEDYPPLLKMIQDPPGILFVRGRTGMLHRPSFCVVGSRIPTPGGMSIARDIARELAEEGLVIVSGLARGIDRSAHLGTLDAGGGTIAVLGCGPDVIYPKECRKEYDRIADEGAIVSELVPGTTPQRCFFPRRNRIMSGMSLGVLVVEAAARSGALITAHHSLEEGREVFAVPGSPLNPLSRGTNGLIKQGAFPVENGQDIVEILKFSGLLGTAGERTAGSDDLLKLLTGGPKHIDELSSRSGRDAGEILACLVELEMNGQVLKMPGMRYRLKSGRA